MSITIYAKLIIFAICTLEFVYFGCGVMFILENAFNYVLKNKIISKINGKYKKKHKLIYGHQTHIQLMEQGNWKNV